MSSSTAIESVEKLNFLDRDQITQIAHSFGTPTYVYSEDVLRESAKRTLAFEAPYGLTVRYAMKANPLSAILTVFHRLGIHIDASSGFEAERAIAAGVDPSRIMITSQQYPDNLEKLIDLGVKFNATSLSQLEEYARHFAATPLSIRLNVGLGSGYRPGVSVAGPNASFGIWHEYLDRAMELIHSYKLTVDTIHSHIGCGNDPVVWHQVAGMTLSLVERFSDVRTLNLGGGFKVARMAGETATDLAIVSADIADLMRDFAARTGRRLHLEIEPGTYLTANAGSLITQVQDIVDTGASGFTFLKLDTGMNDLMRPALHASQHPIVINPASREHARYVVVGHNCESSDLLTPALDDSEKPEPRLLSKASIGDFATIEGVGAYCSAMKLQAYNSFPTPNEVLIRTDGAIVLVNKSLDYRDFMATETSVQ